MTLSEIALIGVGLAMDAFAVSICKGLAMKRMNWKNALIIALYFGVFQALMPALGYLLGSAFSTLVEKIDHWIAFVLLTLIGANMIREAVTESEEEADDRVDFRTMIVLAVATSIDALAVGITFAFLQTAVLPAVTLIGVITFFISLGGVRIGNRFGMRFHDKAGIAGGIILILIGLKILLEHLGIFAF